MTESFDDKLTAAIRAAVDSDQPLVLATTAAAIAQQLQRVDPDGWVAWRDQHIVDVIVRRLRSELQHVRIAAYRAVNRSALEEHAKEIRGVADARYATERNVWAHLVDMCRPDIRSAARMFEKNARGNAVEAIFMRLIEQRLPDDDTPTGDVLDIDGIEALRREAEKQAARKFPIK